jgi:hypothetical protein
MRFYYNIIPKSEYFFFLDDDVYFRPNAMISFLSQVQSSQPFGVIFNDVSRGLEWSKRWSPKDHNCAYSPIFRLYFAQPMIINHAAMQVMKSGIYSNAMYKLQKIWGSSHDAILYILLTSRIHYAS